MAQNLTASVYISRKADGTPNALGYVHTYAAGTLTNQASYTTQAAGTANQNPVELDADGTAAIWLDPALSYRIIEKTAGGTTIRDVDNISGAINSADLSSTASVSLGDALIGVKLDVTGGGERTQHTKNADFRTVTDFYANGVSGALVDPTGVTDSTLGIQAAIDSLVSTGGTILLPAFGRFKVTDQIEVSSTKPINIIGPAGRGQRYSSGVTTPAFVIGANISGSMVKYTAPNSGSRGESGGGTVRGVAFIDETGTPTSVGSYTCTAALELNDAALSDVDGCTFQWINGSAIKGEFVVMSAIKNNTIRYCGAAGKPALHLPSTSAPWLTQATNIEGNKIEVCYGAEYVHIGAACTQVKLIGNGFEADTANAGSNQIFAVVNGDSGALIGNHFNRTTSAQVTVAGGSNAICGNTFQGGAYATTALTVSGNGAAVSGNTFRSARTGVEVLLSGAGNTFVGNTMYASGAVLSTGTHNVIGSNKLEQMACTTAALGAGDDWWISDGPSAAGTVISGNMLTNNGGAVTTVGGIRVEGTGPSVTGNTFDAFNGTGNGAICIRSETGNALIASNLEVNSTTLVSAANAASLAGQFGGNYATGASVLPLTGSKTHDPGSLADGAGETTTVTVTGAVLGDFASAAFSLDLQGVALTAWVSATDTVSVRFQNESGGTVDLASGTLKAKVEHR